MTDPAPYEPVPAPRDAHDTSWMRAAGAGAVKDATIAGVVGVIAVVTITVMLLGYALNGRL